MIIATMSALALVACSAARESVSSGGEKIDIGYGESTTDKITGAAVGVTVDEKEVAPFTSIYDYLRGRVPGLVIGPASAGNTPSIRIRGTNSINSSCEPLILVDGVEVYSLDYLNPNDVKRVSVLKGPEASIYGVRAANGVILITTKR